MDKNELIRRRAQAEVWPIVSTGDDLVWSSTLAKNLNLDAPGAGFLVVAMDIAGVGNLPPIGKDLFGELEIAYVSQIQKGYLVAVKEALSHTLDFLGSELPDGGLSISMGVVVDGVIYLGTVGKAQVFLKRKDSFNKVLGYDEGAKEEQVLAQNLIKAASGFWQEDDVYVFASGNFATHAKLMEFVGDSLTKNRSLNDAAEELTAQVGQREGDQSLAAVVVRVGAKKVVPGAVELVVPVVESGLINSIWDKVPKFSLSLPLSIFSSLTFLKKKAEGEVSSPRYLPDPAARDKRKRQIIAIVSVLVLILGISIIYTRVQSRNLENQKRVETVLSEAQIIYNQAVASQNQTEKRVLLEEANRKIDQAKKLDKNNAKVKELNTKIAQAISDSLQVKNLASLEIFYDLNIIKNGAAGLKMDFDDGEISVLDSSNGSIYSVGVANKSGVIIGGGDQVKGAQSMGLSLGRTFSFKDGTGVVKTSQADKKSELVTVPDSEWGQVAAISAYGSNFYLIDKGKNTIWKYTPTSENSYSKAAFGPTGLSFERAIASSVDGAIWILGSDGTLQKVVKDGSNAYRIVGLDKDLGDKLEFYTDENAEDLYILDPSNSRILVVGKDGQYKKQYVSKDLGSVVDLVVDEKTKIVYLLDGSKIRKFDL